MLQSLSNLNIPSNLYRFLLAIGVMKLCIACQSTYTSEQNKTQNESVTKENLGDDASYILIGAKGRAGKGAVFKCTLDGYECYEFLGGNKRFSPPENRSYKTVNIFNGDVFGASINVFNKKIFIGATGRDNKKANDTGSISSANYKDEVGSLFECDLEGNDCREFLGGHLPFENSQVIVPVKLFSSDHFAASTAFSQNKLLIGVPGRDGNDVDDIGSIFQCNLDGKYCSEFLGGKSKNKAVISQLATDDSFGTSLITSNNFLYIGVPNKNSGSGSVMKCTIDGSKCDFFNLKNLRLASNNNFGTSITISKTNIYVGASGRSGVPITDPQQYDLGAVFKCGLDGNNCSEIIGGENKESAAKLKLGPRDYLGMSIAVFKEYLFIGVPGRMNFQNQRTGAVFRCDLNGSNCIEFIGGKSTGYLDSESLDLLDGDQFGSSLFVVSKSYAK
ncbi:hypothetical protein QEJ31_01145 [Pigmentibacter sp. JX0631]|uniref:hypothetical protein n=1 Tax=Pigmentibacter sp. JX0631 TaxID=2976982 RepID=UPI00246931B2|nr:hypothetical protein [Pigmentibacter sp. JX0631]WGL60209.1 hypothetical protein QEJ31_01145 [Pigmentibacter sp. JX0631]